ncbi:hypothetical protein BT96DRAFT_920459, partial [Gymnopus androsaceus JB14]
SDTLYSLLLNKMRFSVAQAMALLALLTTAHGLNINRFILAILPSELKTSSRVVREASAAVLGATEAKHDHDGHRGGHNRDGHRGGHRDDHGHGRHGAHDHFRRDEDVDDGFRESSSAWGTSTKIEDDGGFGGRGGFGEGGFGRGRDHDRFPGGFGHGFGGYRRAEESEDKFPGGFGGFGGHRDHHRGGHDHDHG